MMASCSTSYKQVMTITISIIIRGTASKTLMFHTLNIVGRNSINSASYKSKNIAKVKYLKATCDPPNVVFSNPHSKFSVLLVLTSL